MNGSNTRSKGPTHRVAGLAVNCPPPGPPVAQAQRRTIYSKPCNAVGGVLRPSVAPIHLVSQAFQGLEAVGEQPQPGVDSVAPAASEAELPPSSCALQGLWIGGPIRGHHMLSKPSQKSGPVMALTPAVCRLDPNSRAPELKSSIKLEPSKHRRTFCSNFSASKHF